jgi:hypothetical protein
VVLTSVEKQTGQLMGEGLSQVYIVLVLFTNNSYYFLFDAGYIIGEVR